MEAKQIAPLVCIAILILVMAVGFFLDYLHAKEFKREYAELTEKLKNTCPLHLPSLRTELRLKRLKIRRVLEHKGIM